MNETNRRARIARFTHLLATANTEAARKELLKGLLIDLFGKDRRARQILEEMSLGAERAVLNIPLPARIKTGFADTQYGRTIIEFEADLSRTGDHAEEQLAEYLLGNWRSGDTYRFTLITTDCREWRVVAPRYEQLADENIRPSDLDLVMVDSIVVGEENTEDFYFFLDRYLFGTEPIRPTLKRIERDFGETGAVFITSLGLLRNHLASAKVDPSFTVAREQWARFLSIAYGSFDRGDEVFLVHTYLSVFAKILAYEVLTGNDRINDAEMRGILTGEIFDRLNVRGFIDRDFFGWVSEELHLSELRPMLREITRAVGQYDFSDVSEDILKGVYQELIDIDTRHALGEYYTPDWLCDRVLAEFEPTKGAHVLDPACGSGSFLRAAIHRLRELHPSLAPEELTQQVVGIDIHPLSVQIAKTTLLLALGPAVRSASQPVTLRVYLANTLRAPEGSVGELFGSSFKVAIDDRTYTLSTRLLDDMQLFDAGVTAAGELAEATRGTLGNPGKEVPVTSLAAAIAHRAEVTVDEELAEDFHKIYQGIKRAKEQGRNGIWKFIVQNLYKPFFLRGQFDVIVGNPPWLTYGDVAVADYQSELAELAQRYGVLPKRANNRTHLEIAAIFQAHAASAFLREDGKMALVMPRSLFSADQHRDTRNGQAKGFKLIKLWDLERVDPLFRVPSCVMFSERAPRNSDAAKRRPKRSGLPGFKVKGRLRGHNQTWEEAKEHLTFESVKWYFASLGARTAFTTRKSLSGTSEKNFYKPYFRQGATIVPRNAYFVSPLQEVPDLADRDLVVQTNPEVARLAKRPWNELHFEGRIHTDFLFRTAQAKNILPFVLDRPGLVLLPARVEPSTSRLELLTVSDLLADGHLETAKWFARVEREWDRLKTQRNARVTFLDYLNWSNKLKAQSLQSRYLVLYNSSAKDANATVVEQGTFDRPFVVDHKAYWFGTDNRREAFYLVAFLNATEPNKMIKDFQTRGLFGARDIHKTILEVPLPRFLASKPDHKALAKLGEGAAVKARTWMEQNAGDEYANVGRMRAALRSHLKPELSQIDKALKRIM